MLRKRIFLAVLLNGPLFAVDDPQINERDQVAAAQSDFKMGME